MPDYQNTSIFYVSFFLLSFFLSPKTLLPLAPLFAFNLILTARQFHSECPFPLMIQCPVSLPELTCQFLNWTEGSFKITGFQATEILLFM